MTHTEIVDPVIQSQFRSKDFNPYITKIALVNDYNEVIMIAAVPIPIRKISNQKMIFKIQMDF